MDPIHPIVPGSEDPAPVDRVRRVTRAGEESPRDHAEPRERREPSQQRAEAAVTADGHLDVRA